MHHFNYRGAHVTSRFDREFIRMNDGFPFSAIMRDGAHVRAMTLHGLKCTITRHIRASMRG